MNMYVDTDGRKVEVDELKNAKKISKVGPDDVGRPYRVGFSYDMAEPEHRGQYKCELKYITEPVNSTTVSFEYYVRVKGECYNCYYCHYIT